MIERAVSTVTSSFGWTSAISSSNAPPRDLVHDPPHPTSFLTSFGPPVAKHKQAKLDGKQHVCAACSEAQRESEVPHFGRRKPLADLSVNTTMRSRDGDWERRKRPPRTLY